MRSSPAASKSVMMSTDIVPVLRRDRRAPDFGDEDVVAGAEADDVEAVAAGHAIIAGAGDQAVVTAAAHQRVVAGIAGQDVGRARCRSARRCRCRRSHSRSPRRWRWCSRRDSVELGRVAADCTGTKATPPPVGV